MPPKRPITVSLVSLGCPKNLVDSEKMLALLAEGGCVVGAAMDQADVIVVNTCGFLSAARRESLAVIREALSHKSAGRCRRVVVAGCLSNRDGPKLYDQAPGIDAVVGVNDRDEILAAVAGARRVTLLPDAAEDQFGFRISDFGLKTSPGAEKAHLSGNPKSEIPNLESEMPNLKSGISNPKSGIPNPKSILVPDDTGRFRLTPRHTAYLRIAEGCSQRCTFCTIPAIRGPLRSKPPEVVLREARELIDDGAVELNVIAQDTTAYGMDLGRDAHVSGSGGFARRRGDLAHLLRRLDSLDGVRWIRLLYTYPRRFTDSLIDAIAECRRVVPYVDLPLQHVCDPILRRMGRGVTGKTVEALLARLRRRIPGLVLRTTFIVGFPGETDGQFAELLEFVRGFRFDALGVFEFSPEEGTPAAAMPRQVPAQVKAERARAIMLAQQEIAFAASALKVGEPIEVLVDGLDASGRCVGRHYGQAPDIDGLCILRRPRPAGTFVRAAVKAWKGYDLVVG
jgi:ribosomal protein S12 methylthiotransferase